MESATSDIAGKLRLIASGPDPPPFGYGKVYLDGVEARCLMRVGAALLESYKSEWKDNAILREYGTIQSKIASEMTEVHDIYNIMVQTCLS